jgi:hypothetical protein
MTAKPDEPHDPTDMSHRLYDSAKDPSSPFYEGNKSDAEQKPDPSEEDTYKVGPGFPPNEHKWKEGCPSPNPKGRPRKVPSMKPEIKKIFEDALNEKVHVTKADKKITLTRLAMGFERLAIQFANGDRHARHDVFTYAAMLGVDLQAKQVIEEVLGATDQAIVEAAFLRRQQQLSPQPAPDDHVKAPPDLIDDDVTKSAPNATRTASPQPGTPAKKPIEPVLDEQGKPLPVSDMRYVQAIRERNLAQQKKDQGGS